MIVSFLIESFRSGIFPGMIVAFVALPPVILCLVLGLKLFTQKPSGIQTASRSWLLWLVGLALIGLMPPGLIPGGPGFLVGFLVIPAVIVIADGVVFQILFAEKVAFSGSKAERIAYGMLLMTPVILLVLNVFVFDHRVDHLVS